MIRVNVDNRIFEAQPTILLVSVKPKKYSPPSFSSVNEQLGKRHEHGRPKEKEVQKGLGEKA